MKQSKIMIANKTLESIADNFNLTKKEQWELYKLRVALRPHVDFQIEQEELVRDKYRKFADKDGNLSGETADHFIEEMRSIGDLDVELGIAEIPKIRMADGITFKLIEPLEGFVEFLPPED